MNCRILNLFLLLFLTLTGYSSDMDKANSYIDKYKNISVQEMRRSGIPASIKLAQGMVESSWGESNLAKEANNHFGIKCGKNWSGSTYFKHDDDYNNDGNLIESCFRAYNDANESFVSHTEFLADQSKKARYGFLFNYGATDYVSWANGLKLAGYATDPNYPQKLIQTIEKFGLYKFDEEVSISDKTNNQILASQTESKISKPSDEAIVYNKVLKKNDLAYIVASGNETANDIAKKVNIPVRSILSFNEIISVPQEKIPANTMVYLEKKHRDYEGDENQHLVKEGETIELISQIYGLRASTLRSINRLSRNENVSRGDIINLKPLSKSAIKENRKKSKRGKKEKSEFLLEF